jgi:hypothetical protein
VRRLTERDVIQIGVQMRQAVNALAGHGLRVFVRARPAADKKVSVMALCNICERVINRKIKVFFF